MWFCHTFRDAGVWLSEVRVALPPRTARPAC